ncbi:MAG: gliding motility-associated C-terminal domain-containing protein [Candidatus Cloacimonetes bacterium]|nr:gliding motility-associated C-terminal domain-containing protein [Candidatus Cloacimonadota bacterium]
MDSLPQFVGGNPFSYELTKYSPCIDKGTPDTTGLNLPATDLAGNQRIYNGRIDIGAYEYQGYGIDQPDTSFIHSLYLFQNTPNPFNNETEILFITADYERVENYTLSIYNTKGQLVRRYDGKTNDFWVKTKIVWDGTDEYGRQVAPGTYLYKLEYNGNAVVRKMIRIR